MSEGRDWLAALLRHPKAANHTVARARALTLAGDLAVEQEGNIGLARLYYEESMLISTELSDRQGVATTLLGLGTIAYAGGDVAGAQSVIEQSLEIWQTLEESWGVAWATHRLGDLAFEQSDMESARLFYNECLVIRREIGDKSGIGWLFQRLGEIARYEGFYDRAQALYEEALRLHRELASNGGVTATITSMGYLALNQGNFLQARSLFKEGISQNLGNQILNALCLIGLAGAVIDPVKAARWLGAADSIFKQSSSFIDRVDRDRILTAVHAQINESAFAVAWEAGRSMLLDQAIETALQDERTREFW
jgi:tetratricopeptide (TPR) repeat protein